MKNINVLVVDDEEPFAVNLSKLLTRRGYTTATAENGLTALRMIGENPFDVVLLDLKMPGLGGIETLREIKKKRPEIQVIILTGHGTVDSAMDGISLGAFDYAMKPITIRDLQEKIDQAHERKLLEEERMRSFVEGMAEKP
ncbi:MAG: response regulator [Deltaproteobacteria bacterium]|nr:response regulator [Deltaproteobacteria bacterium]